MCVFCARTSRRKRRGHPGAVLSRARGLVGRASLNRQAAGRATLIASVTSDSPAPLPQPGAQEPATDPCPAEGRAWALSRPASRAHTGSSPRHIPACHTCHPDRPPRGRVLDRVCPGPLCSDAAGFSTPGFRALRQDPRSRSPYRSRVPAFPPGALGPSQGASGRVPGSHFLLLLRSSFRGRSVDRIGTAAPFQLFLPW